MSSKTIKGLTIEIGGDTTKLGKALEGINKKSRDLSQELGHINGLLKMDPKNTELLAQKQKVLAEAIANTSGKLETLREAEKQVQKQFERGEVSEEQVRALQREIVATTQKLDGYEKAAKETEEQIRKVGKASKDTGEKASQMGDKLKTAGAIAAKSLAAVVSIATAAATALSKATADAAAYADNVLTLSTVTGISTEKLQAYAYAAELVDVDVDTLTKSHAKQIKSMKAAQDGTQLAVEAYEKLGVSVTNADGSLRDGETVYWEVIDALGRMENETERDAIAMQILGKSAQELNPLIEAGASKMAELTQEAKEVGAVLSEEALYTLGAFDDSLQRLKGSSGAAKNALGTVLLPELTALTHEGAALLSEFTTNLNASGGGLEGFVATVDQMSGEVSEKAGDLVGKALAKASELIPAIVKVGTSLAISLGTAVAKELPSLVRTVTGTLIDCTPTLLDGAFKLLLAVVDAVDLLIPPLIEAVPGIVMCIVSGLVDATPSLIDGALTLLLAVCDAIPLLIEELVPLLPEIGTTIILGLLDCTPKLIEAAFKLLTAIPQAIPKACVALLKSLPRIGETIFSYLKQLPGKIASIGGELVKGLWEGISNRATWLKDQIKGWVGNVTEFLKKLFGINSPSKVTSWMGEMLDEGFAQGIKDNAQAPVKAMGRLSDRILTEAEDMNGLTLERRIRHSFNAPATVSPTASGMMDKLDKILQAIERGHVILLDGDTVVGSTADRMNSTLGQSRVLSERGAL